MKLLLEYHTSQPTEISFPSFCVNLIVQVQINSLGEKVTLSIANFLIQKGIGFSLVT